MSKINSAFNLLSRFVLVMGALLAICGLSAGKAEASDEPWYTVATGTCAYPTLTDQMIGGTQVLIVGGGLMPGSSFMYTISAYGDTSRGLSWSLLQNGQADQYGNFCVVAFVTDLADQGNFKVQINGVDYWMRQYNPAIKVFTVLSVSALMSSGALIVDSAPAVQVTLPVNPVISPLPGNSVGENQ